MVYRADVAHVSRFLQEVDLFQGLSMRYLDRIAALCEEYRFQAGEYLGVYDQLGSRLYVIQQGEVTVTTGSEQINLFMHTIRERETVSVGALLEPPLLATTSKAATDGLAFVLPRVRLMELCELEPQIGMHIYRAIGGIFKDWYNFALTRLADVAESGIHHDHQGVGGAGSRPAE